MSLRPQSGPEERAIALCRATLEQHSKSFSLAARLLPPQRRDDAAVVYAWCRHADDAIDESPPEVQPAALAALREGLARCFGTSELASTAGNEAVVLRAFQLVCRRRQMPRAYPEELLQGMEMDVLGTHYQTLEELLLYCHRVAGVVGTMMCHVLGVSPSAPDALVQAAHLGWGMQLTNICRDVQEDYGRGRVYLPHDLLEAHGARLPVPEPGFDFPASQVRPVAKVVQELLGVADRLYSSGVRGLRALDVRSAFGVDVARRVYSAIGGAIERQEFNITAGRAYVPLRSKLRHVSRAAVSSARSLTRRRWDGYAPPTRVLTFEAALEAMHPLD